MRQRRRIASESSSGTESESVRCDICRKFMQPPTMLKPKSNRVSSQLQCSDCESSFHRSCLDFDAELARACAAYDWQCNRCKTCEVCGDGDDEASTLLCDQCDRGYHMYCLAPRLYKRPEGDWRCPKCEADVQTNSVDCSTDVDATPLEKQLHVDVTDVRRSSNFKSLLRKRLHSPGFAAGSPSSKKRQLKRVTREVSPAPSKPETPSPASTVELGKVRVKKLCRTPGCNGMGHMGGYFERHTNQTTCPMYHNLGTKECNEFYTDRLRSNSKGRREDPAAHDCLASWSKERTEINRRLITQHVLRAELQKKHREEHSRNREPLLDGLTTDKDLYLFRQVESTLAYQMETGLVDARMNETSGAITAVVFGPWEIQTWYPSPYPITPATLYVCEFCLKYMKSPVQMESHSQKCATCYPPGNEIYRSGSLSFWEVDGKKATAYCQNLCLFAKLFLDHKTLYFDVEPFLFYILTAADKTGCHLVGYFSKEKKSFMNCNLSCILVLPHQQRLGYGRLLIDFSYLLSRVEKKIGSPERPLSDLGLMTYRNYWRDCILDEVGPDNESVNIREISQNTGIQTNDIVSTLQFFGMVKYWKNRHWFYMKKEILDEYNRRRKARPLKKVKPKLLHWTPHPETLTS